MRRSTSSRPRARSRRTRNEFGLGLNYVVRDSMLTLALSSSKEPDYEADAFERRCRAGGVRRHDDGEPGLHARLRQGRQARCRLLRQREALAVPARRDADPEPRLAAQRQRRGDLRRRLPRQPVPRRARFRRPVPERNPRTRTSRAIKLRTIGDLGSRNAVRAEYRYFWDTWDIRAHTAEAGYSRYFGDLWLADAFVRYNTQSGALFYSDNATSETTLHLAQPPALHLRQRCAGRKGRPTRTARWPARYELKLTGAYEAVRFDYKDFTDMRNGSPYSFIGQRCCSWSCRPRSEEGQRNVRTMQDPDGRLALALALIAAPATWSAEPQAPASTAASRR